MEDTLKEQGEIKDKRLANLLPYQFKKGQSGNPLGRPPGKSLKERAKAMLNAMTEEEEQEFLNGLDKRIIWEMAEGKPDTKTDITSKGEKILVMPTELINKNAIDTKPE